MINQQQPYRPVNNPPAMQGHVMQKPSDGYKGPSIFAPKYEEGYQFWKDACVLGPAARFTQNRRPRFNQMVQPNQQQFMVQQPVQRHPVQNGFVGQQQPLPVQNG